MAKLMTKRSVKAGLPPGTPLHIGEEKTEKVRITVFEYDEEKYREREVKEIEECFASRDKPTVTWINVDGVHEVEIIEKIGGHFGLHPLTLEDIPNTQQRAKMEVFDEYIFAVLRMLYYGDDKDKVTTEQVSLVLGSNFVISFQETGGDVFDPIRERIRSGKARIRKLGSDYLAYSLIDAIVDNYFAILERLGEKVETLEEKVVTNPSAQTLQGIHELKREMISLRKSVWPLREVISRLETVESALIKKATRLFLRDVYDHTIQVIDTIESLRDRISGMLDIYLSSMSNKMNQIMKVLTIIATIFIPLTFIVGIYGMNFKHMPEIDWPWSYPIIWVVMVGVAAWMLIYFRRKKWI